MSVENKQENSLIYEIMLHKCFSLSYTHVMLRAHWFFSTHIGNKNFETFLGMKQLKQSGKREKKVVKFRNSIKMSVDQQLRDMKTLSKFCVGSEMMQGQSTRLKCLLFKMDMEEDKGWHPALIE